MGWIIFAIACVSFALGLMALLSALMTMFGE
jgi:hypothetical protein